MLQSKNKIPGIIKSVASCLLIIVLVSLFVIYKQRIIDQILVWQYQPTSEVVSIFNRSGMNENGKFYFYMSKPKIDATQSFNNACNRVEQTTSILGCYDGQNIFIFDVKDEKLDGIKEVTAVHETLHAVYSRLSDADKIKLNNLLEIEYEKLKKDKDFTDLISFYDRTEPGQRYNELHSIVGTEIGQISTELENYYSRYFADRKKIVALDLKYSGVFKLVKSRADELAVKLNDLSAVITSQTSDYNSKTINLNKDIAVFNNRAANGDFGSMSQFYNERYLLSVRASNLDLLRSNINDNIKNYESILAEYNSIALESKKLYNAIDSTLAPAPSV